MLENHYLIICRHAVTRGMYAPGAVVFLSHQLLKKEKVILVTLGEVDNKFSILQKNNVDLSILNPDKV